MINLFTPIIKSINVFLEKIATAANAFKSFTELLTGKKATESKPIQSATNDLSGLEDEYNSVSNASNNMASNTEDSANATADQAEATQEATEAAEDYLSPLDDINRMSKETASQETGTTPSGGNGASGNGGIVGAGVDFGEAAKGNTVLDETSSLIDKIIARVKELGDLFKKGFWDGLGDYKPILEELKKDLSSIGRIIANIITDKDVQTATKKFANSFIYNWGKIVGSFAKIGLTIAENIVGGIESYLSKNVDRIKKYLISMFDIGAEIMNLRGILAQTVADIFSSVFGSQVAQDLTGNVIGIFADVIMGVNELFAKFGRDLLNLIVQPLVENKEKIKTALLETIEPIQAVTQSIQNFLQSVIDKVMEVYDEHIKPFIDSITDGISEIAGTLLDTYNEYIAPVLDSLASKFDEVLNGPVGEAINSILNLIGKIIDVLKLLWEELLVPFISWIIENIVPIIAPIIEFLGTTVLDFFGTVAEVISGIVDILSGLIDFIVGVFTGNWEQAFSGLKQIGEGFQKAILSIFTFIENNILKPFDIFLQGVFEKDWTKSFGVFGNVLNAFFKKVKNIWNSIKQVFNGIITFVKGVFSGNWRQAWEGVKQIFAGVFNGLKSIAIAPINGIISIINGAIGLINDAISSAEDAFTFGPWDVPTPFGDVTIGYEASFPRVPTIPYLASGAVIPPNKEFMAVLGDQKHGNNIEAPESLIRRIVREEAAGGGNKYEVALKVGRRELAKLVIDEAKLMRQQTGKNPFELA